MSKGQRSAVAAAPPASEDVTTGRGRTTYQRAPDTSDRHGNLPLTEKDLIKGGRHVLVVYDTEPKSVYDHVAAAAQTAAIPSTGNRVSVNEYATDDPMKSLTALVYYVDSENGRMGIAYPLIMFYGKAADGRAMLQVNLAMSIRDLLVKGKAEYGEVLGVYFPSAVLRPLDGPACKDIDVWRTLGRPPTNARLASGTFTAQAIGPHPKTLEESWRANWQGGNTVLHDKLQMDQIGSKKIEYIPEVDKAMRHCIEEAGSSRGLEGLSTPSVYSAVCVKGTIITDASSIDNGKVICRVTPGDMLDIFGDQKMEESGVLRSQGTTRDGGRTGWITLRGNGGSAYVVPHPHLPAPAAGLDGGAIVRARRNGEGSRLGTVGGDREGPAVAVLEAGGERSGPTESQLEGTNLSGSSGQQAEGRYTDATVASRRHARSRKQDWPNASPSSRRSIAPRIKGCAPGGEQVLGLRIPRARVVGPGGDRGMTHHHHPDHAEHSVHEDKRHHNYARHQSPPLLGPSLSEAEQGCGWRGSAGSSAAVSLPSHPSRHGYYGDRGPSRDHSPTSLPVVSGDEIGR